MSAVKKKQADILHMELENLAEQVRGKPTDRVQRERRVPRIGFPLHCTHWVGRACGWFCPITITFVNGLELEIKMLKNDMFYLWTKNVNLAWTWTFLLSLLFHFYFISAVYLIEFLSTVLNVIVCACACMFVCVCVSLRWLWPPVHQEALQKRACLWSTCWVVWYNLYRHEDNCHAHPNKYVRTNIYYTMLYHTVHTDRCHAHQNRS